MTTQETSLLALRFSRLDAAGLPDAGATNGWAASDPISLQVQFQFDTGTDVVQKDGAGRLCFVRKRPDNIKNANVNLETCGGDPRFLELILNGPGVVIGGETPTGFGIQNGACDTGVRDGVFIEWFTENYLCNTQNSADPNSRHFLPRAIMNYDGGTWDEGRHAYAFSGVANAGVVKSSTQTATGTGGDSGGPFNDIVGFTEDAGYLYGYTTGGEEATILADLVAGYTVVPAQ